jgi:hypothetical protein
MHADAMKASLAYEMLNVFRGVGDDENIRLSLLDWLTSAHSLSCFGMPLLMVLASDDGTSARLRFNQPYEHGTQPELKLRGKWEPPFTYFDAADFALRTELVVMTRAGKMRSALEDMHCEEEARNAVDTCAYVRELTRSSR